MKDALIHDTVCLINFDAVNRRKWLEEERRRIHRRLTVRQAKKVDKDSKYKMNLYLFAYLCVALYVYLYTHSVDSYTVLIISMSIAAFTNATERF